MKKNISSVFFIILVLIITGLTLAPLLSGDFTNWDDPVYVVDNPLIQNLSFQNTLRIFGTFSAEMYRPLVTLSYSIERHFFGLNPHVFHATNLIFHLLNCILVFWFFAKITQCRGIASFVALFFGIHPMHVESVAWIAERKDVLYSVFFLAALITYLHFKEKQSTRFYLLTLGLFFFSLLSKPMALTLPGVLILLDYFLEAPARKDATISRTIIEKIPFFALSTIFGFLGFWTQKISGAISEERSKSSLGIIHAAADSIIFYLVKLTAPLKLSAVYPLPEHPGEWLGTGIFSSVSLLAFLALMVFFYGRKSKKVIFGVLFFLITALPVLQLVPAGFAMAADRYTYIPSLGIFYLYAVFFHTVYSLHAFDGRARTIWRYSACAFLFLVAMNFSRMTYGRCQVWHDSIALWDDVISKYPTVSFAFNNRANAYLAQQKKDQAFVDASRAIQLKPDAGQTKNNMNTGGASRSLYDKALEDYNRAIELKPDFSNAYFNRAVEFTRRGEIDKAIEDYLKVLQYKPSDAEASYNLANKYGDKGMSQAAIFFYNRAVASNPFHSSAYNNRGYEYEMMGDLGRAIKDYKQALAVDPTNSLANKNLVRARQKCPACE